LLNKDIKRYLGLVILFLSSYFMSEQKMDLSARIENVKAENDSVKKFREYIKFLQAELTGKDATLIDINSDELGLKEKEAWFDYAAFIKSLNEEEYIKNKAGLRKSADGLLLKARQCPNKDFVNWMNNRLASPVMLLSYDKSTWEDMSDVLQNEKEKLFFDEFSG